MERFERAEAVLAEFLRRWDAGEEPTLDELCAEHPELEPELREAHADWLDFGRRLRSDPERDPDLFGKVELPLTASRPSVQRLAPLVVPSPWASFAKLVLGLALIVALAFAALRAVGEKREPFELFAARGGGQIEADPLYLGPGRATVTLAFSGREDAALVGSRLRVVSDATGKELQGFYAKWTGPGDIRLHATVLEGFRRERVRLEPVEGEAEFRPFTLVLLGRDSWTVSELGFGDRPVDAAAKAPAAIDPEDLEVTVWIAGEGRDELAQVSVRTPRGEPRRMALRGEDDGRARYALALERLELHPGPVELTVRVRDAAGRESEQALPVRVIADPLHVDVEGLFLPAPEGEWIPATRGAAGVVLAPDEEPVLRVETRRPAELEWRLFAGDATEPSATGREEALRIHEVSLGGALAELAPGPSRGRLEYTVDEDELVRRADTSTGGRRSGAVSFTRTAGRARFSVQLVQGLRRIALPPDGMAFASAEETRLLLASEAVVPSRVFIHLDGPDGSRRPVEPRTLPAGKSLELPLALGEPGGYRLVVQSYQLDPDAETPVDRPDVVQRFRVVVDDRAPELELRAERELWTAADRNVPLEFEARIAYGGTADAAVRALDCRLLDTAAGDLPLREWRTEGEAPFRFTVPDPDRDGEFALEVSGTDLAGNRTGPARVPFQLARDGPRVELVPAPGRAEAAAAESEPLWLPEASGLWALRLRVDDPNGIALVDAVLRDGERELGIALTSSDDVWTGRVELDPAWSRARPELRVSALDRYANETVLRVGDLRLPEIRPPCFARVRVAFGEAPVTAMRRVPGNADHAYVFGGRGDEIENELFRSAGLAPLNAELGRAPSLSFATELPPGTIEDFYLDEHEVSNAAFLAFVTAPDGYDAARQWPAGSGSPSSARRAALLVRLRDARADLPVHGVTWEEAAAYAHWTRKRLPSWREWEIAVRGGERYRPFASWRGSPESGGRGRDEGPRAIGEGDDVASETGVRDLCSNLSEWTGTACPGATDSYWIAGGSFATPVHDFAVVDDRPRTWSGSSVGFRCALSAREVEERLSEGTSPGSPTWIADAESVEGGSP